MANNPKYYIIESSALPEVFLKVAEAKRLLDTGEASTVNDATRQSGISRSAFYKYRDSILPFQNLMAGRIIMIPSLWQSMETGPIGFMWKHMGLPPLERIDGRPVRVLCRHRISQISQEKCSFNNNLFNDMFFLCPFRLAERIFYLPLRLSRDSELRSPDIETIIAELGRRWEK